METPNFASIASRIVKLRGDLEDEDMAEMIVEQLRLVWNARGAADIARVTAVDDGAGTSGVVFKDPEEDVARAIQCLDR